MPWTPLSTVMGAKDSGYLFECPDLFELSVAESDQKRWVLFGADGQYAIGAFDGTKFAPEAERLQGHWSHCPYAAQTFDNAPHGRRILIPWLRAPSPGMSFNQCMGVPQELGLAATAEGLRLTRRPVNELKVLRAATHALPHNALTPASENPLQGLQAELIELELACTLAAETTLELNLRGIPIVYDMAKQSLQVAGHEAPWPLQDGVLALHLYLDRTSIELFSADGVRYLPLDVIPDKNLLTSSLRLSQGSANITRGVFYRLNSIWK